MILIYLLSASCFISAQNQFAFNKIFENSVLGISSVSAEINDGHYFVATLMGDQAWGGVYLRILELEGEEIELISIDEGTELRSIVFGGNMKMTNDAIMLASAESEQAFGGETDILLAKLDLNGNVIWKKSYGDSLSQKPAQILPTSDNGYLIVGAEQHQLNPARFYALKLDEAGDVEWENTYGLDGHSAAFSAVQTQDGGYLISGYGYHITKGYESLLVKTDAAGNEQWQTHYGTLDDDAAARIVRKSDNAYWMIGGTRESGNYNLFMQEIDDAGNQIWHKSYYKNAYFAPQTNLAVLQDGNLAAAGFYANIGNSGTTAFLAKFTPEGDTLWVRGYQTNPFTQDYFRDVDPAPDGGYLLTGFVFESPQKSWVVKTDANGNTCSFVGCDSTIMAPDAVPFVERNPYQISVSPNPATDYGEVNYRFPMRSPCGYIRLFNLAGKEVLAERLHTHAQSQTLNLSGLPAGIYAYSVTFEGRRMFAGKLVVK